MGTIKKILAAIKKFFIWPYNVYTIIIGYGAIVEFIIEGRKLDGIIMIILGVWAFLIEFNKLKP
jgi:hypothetical protein